MLDDFSREPRRGYHGQLNGEQTTKPPPVLASARVLEYAILDGSVGFSGKSRVFVESRELGRVPRLAIGQVLEAGEVLLLYCDEEWSVLTAAGYSSPAHAKARAERTIRACHGSGWTQVFRETRRLYMWRRSRAT